MFANDDAINPYLQQEVLSASPARLRWMLIRRAEELCGIVQHLWDSGQPEQADQWMLRVREILGELLDGVTDAKSELGKTVADFYVFLIQMATELETNRDRDRLQTLRDLLAIELETWRLVIEDLADPRTEAKPSSPPVMPHLAFDGPLSDEAFNFEA